MYETCFRPFVVIVLLGVFDPCITSVVVPRQAHYSARQREGRQWNDFDEATSFVFSNLTFVLCLHLEWRHWQNANMSRYVSMLLEKSRIYGSSCCDYYITCSGGSNRKAFVSLVSAGLVNRRRREVSGPRARGIVYLVTAWAWRRRPCKRPSMRRLSSR